MKVGAEAVGCGEDTKFMLHEMGRDDWRVFSRRVSSPDSNLRKITLAAAWRTGCLGGKNGSKKIDWGLTAIMKAGDAGGLAFGGNNEGSRCHQIQMCFSEELNRIC